MNDNAHHTSEVMSALKAEPEPLKNLLPDLEEIPYDILKEKFKELAVRCFNSENKLDLALEIYKTDQDIIKEQRKYITELKEEILKFKPKYGQA